MKVGSSPDQVWLDRIRLGVVRLNVGGSASLASLDGLVLTNHHIVEDCLKDVARPGTDLLANGFLAARRNDEKQCPGVQAQILLSIDDVTQRLRTAVEHASPNDRRGRINTEIERIEGDACRDKKNARCDVVNLYGGGQYKLYTYRTYDDVRIVFAPEIQTAGFGGDPDNFNFPRFALDMALLRLYENGRPATTPERLRWNPTGPRAGELVYVAGHPRSTSRSQTASQFEIERDLPNANQFVRAELRGRLHQFMAQGPTQRRMGQTALLTQENQFKYYYGGERALTNPAIIASRRAEEAEIRAFLAANPNVAADIGDPWADIARAQEKYRAMFLEYKFLEDRAGLTSNLFGLARALVRAANDGKRPDPKSPPGWVLERKAVEPALERIALELWLTKTREYLTVDHPAVRRMLGRETAEGLAARLVRGTRIAEPAVRHTLWRGGKAAIRASSDPMVRFASVIEGDARAIGERYRREVGEPMADLQMRLAKARFAALGDSVAPDATATLRLSYGTVAGWDDSGGRKVEPFTTFAGLFDRANGVEPFVLAPKWTAARKRLDLATPFNVATTADSVDGNSGSPLIGADGRLVGLIFDLNIHALGWPGAYDSTRGRSIAITSVAMLEALSKVYGADALVHEIMRP